jgi:hypothetical protein
MAQNNLSLFRKNKTGAVTLNGVRRRVAFKNKRDQDHWLEGLRRAGVDEE